MHLKQLMTIILVIGFVTSHEALCTDLNEEYYSSSPISSSSLVSEETELTEALEHHYEVLKRERGIAVKAAHDLIVTPLIDSDIESYFEMHHEHKKSGGEHIASAVRTEDINVGINFASNEEIAFRAKKEIYTKIPVESRAELLFVPYAIYLIDDLKEKTFVGYLEIGEIDNKYFPGTKELDHDECGWADVSIIIRPAYYRDGIAYEAIRAVYYNFFKSLIGKYVPHFFIKTVKQLNNNNAVNQQGSITIDIDNEYGVKESYIVNIIPSQFHFKGLQAKVSPTNIASLGLVKS